MEDIIEAAKGKFSRDEIEGFIHMGQRITSKAVLTAACEVLKTSSHKDAERLVARLEKLIPKAAGVVVIDLHGMDMKLNISLSVCPADYVAEILVPEDDGFKRDLYQQYDNIKKLAVTYWKQFSEDNKILVDQLNECCPGVFDDLKIGEGAASTTVYFDAGCPKRAGVFPYYTDLKGQPFVKKGGKK